jgi:hypothetical protein
MPTPNKDWEEEVLFWGTAIAIFIFAGGVMIFTNHSRHKSESTPAQTYSLMARETKIGPALDRSLLPQSCAAPEPFAGRSNLRSTAEAQRHSYAYKKATGRGHGEGKTRNT